MSGQTRRGCEQVPDRSIPEIAGAAIPVWKVRDERRT
jgi:hypothetical protein